MTRKFSALPFDIEIELLDSLHGSLKSLAAGTFGVGLVGALCCLVSGDKILRVLACLLVATAAWRFLTTYFYRRAPIQFDEKQLNDWKRRTVFAAAAFSAALGGAGFVGLLTVADANVLIPLVAVVIGYAASAASRNAGYPACVTWQLLLAIMPLSLAFVLKGGLANIAIGFLLAMAIAAMLEISHSLHQTLVRALLFGREKHALADELATQAAIFNTALNNMAHGLAMFDACERMVVCNRQFMEVFQLESDRDVSPEEIMRSTARAGLLPAAEAAQMEDLFASKSRSFTPEEMTLFLSDGRIFDLSFQPMARGGSVVVAHDVTERQEQADKIAHMARFDKLTGLPNRTQFEEKFAEILARSSRDGHPFAVVCIDLDHFKEVNDTLTHMVGDQLLVCVAGRMKALTRATDLVARFGGDEFVLILALHDADKAVAEVSSALQRLTEGVAEPYEIDSHAIMIGMSAGVAIAPVDGRSRDDILRAADLALYQAKQQGRGAFCFFEPSLDAAAQERRQIVLDMRSALTLDQFKLEYQPILDIETGRIASCEALMRWDMPGRQIAPDKFIAIAEETGMIAELGRWALFQACRDAASWPRPLPVAVNLSPAQFKRGNLVETIAAALLETGLDASRLELEITENLVISNDDATRRTIADIVALGCSLTLDDFGAGYSTFGYLISFPFKKVKLDKGFIDHIESRPEHRAIIRAVRQMAMSMSMSIVAEGVENERQLDILREEKVHYAQGWLFSKSVPSDKIPWRKFAKKKVEALRVA